MMLKAGVEANTIGHTTVIKARAEARDVTKAEHFMCMMLKASVEANTISHTTVIKAKLSTGPASC